MRVVFLAFFSFLFLCSCAEDGAFSGVAGGTGTGGTGTGAINLGTVAIKTSIPKEIPDGVGGLLPITYAGFTMGNSDASIAYIVSIAVNNQRLFKPTGTGPVELHATPAIMIMNVSGDGNKVLSTNFGKEIIDYASGALLTIGSATGADIPRVITDDGSIVAFNSRKDLTGIPANTIPNQLFTLSTDGSEIYNQITSFTTDFLLENVQISGDGTKIAFGSTDDVLEDGSNADGSDEIFLMNTDGTGLVQLTTLDSGFGLVRSIRISADGGMVSAVLDDFGGATGFTVYAIATATAPYPLTYIADTFDYTGGEYDLSADGTKIAYLSTTTSPQTLYLINTDGTSNTAVLNTVNAGVGGFMDRPHINADGSQISFDSSGDYGATIPSTDLATQIYTLTLP